MRVYVDASPVRGMCLVAEKSDGSLRPPVMLPLPPESTSNQAEYYAILWALNRYPNVREILSDSKLAVKQLKMEYTLNDKKLLHLATEIWQISDGVTFTWIHRKQNPAGRVLG